MAYSHLRLISQLTQEDTRMAAREGARVNIHRIALYFEAAGRVRDRVAAGETPACAFAAEFTPCREMHRIAKRLDLGLTVERGQWILPGDDDTTDGESVDDYSRAYGPHAAYARKRRWLR